MFNNYSRSNRLRLLPVIPLPKDQEEYQKIHRAIEEMMPKALQLGGAPYSKGRQWAPYLEEQMRETGYWSLGKAIKKLVDPNNIMNPGVIGF